MSGFSRTVEGQRGGGTTPPRFGKDALKGAEQIAGLSFTDAEEEAALGGVSRNLDAYEQLRKIDVPLDTEPAITFRPYLPGKQPSGRMSATGRGAKLAIGKSARVQVSSNLEELAFEPVTALASLIESRKVSSTDLTKMYLARAEALRRSAALRHHLDRGAGARPGHERRQGNQGGTLSRSAARHSVGRERSARDQRHPDDVGPPRRSTT